VRVLVVEDEAALRAQLADALTRAGYAVDSAPDGRRADFLGHTEDYDAIVLDLGLPGVDGLTVLRAWRDAGMSAPVLVLTARGSWSEKVQGIDAGADDYVAKPFSPREVVARVQALLRRAGAPGTSPAAVTVAGTLEVDHFKREVRVGGRPLPLTPTELKLIEALARAPGRTFTREELVARAFGPDYEGLDRTIDTHVTNLRRKLERGGCRHVVATVHGVGYRLADDDAAG